MKKKCDFTFRSAMGMIYVVYIESYGATFMDLYRVQRDGIFWMDLKRDEAGTWNVCTVWPKDLSKDELMAIVDQIEETLID